MIYDTIVVGGGVMGLATAYALAKQGKKTLVLEQFPLPHTRGSSSGATRITRQAYVHSVSAKMMKLVPPMWATLEEESGMTLYRQTEMLCITSTRHETFLKYYKSSKGPDGKDVELMDGQTLAKRYPLLNFPLSAYGCLDPESGVLYSGKCLQAYQRVFLSKGGDIIDNCKVQSITPGDTVTVHTANGDYQSKGVVLTCGPWANQLLGDLGVVLPLEVQSIKLGYFKTKNDIDHRKLPVFISFHEDGSFYGFPADEYDNMIKICLHYGYTVPCDPDARDKYDPERQARDMALLKDYVTEHFPGLIPEIAIQEMCVYTCTPDMNCIIDHHPVHKNIVYGAGFSGHGFKLSPMIGEMLAAIVQKKTHTFLSTSELRLERFTKTSKL